MRSLLPSSIFAVALSFATSALAESPAHFEGQTFTDISQAVKVFNDYNKRFEEKLEGELNGLDLHEIHELTYTMENAVAYITQSMYTVAEELEAVHQATELSNPDVVKKSGKKYLELSRNIVR